MKRFAHALIVGGMLADLAGRLEDRTDRISILARTEKRILAISAQVTPLATTTTARR